MIAWLGFFAMMLPHALAAMESPEAAYADYTPVYQEPITIHVQDMGASISFLITLRVRPEYPAEYVYAEKTITLTGMPGGAVPPINWYPKQPESYESMTDVVSLTKPARYGTYCVSVQAQYHYSGRITNHNTAPVCWTGQAPPPPPVFYFNESTFRAYEPSWGFSNCFHTFSWEMGGADMICSPEPYIGF